MKGMRIASLETRPCVLTMARPEILAVENTNNTIKYLENCVPALKAIYLNPNLLGHTAS